jgi:hypothetical protein
MRKDESLSQFIGRLDKAALSVILDPRNEESCCELRNLIGEYKNLAPQLSANSADDIWHHKLLGLCEEILVSLERKKHGSANQRHGLIVSYVRTMRSFIGRLTASEAITRAIQPE